MKKKISELIKEYCLIIIGAFLMAVSVNSSFDAMEVVVGGITGIGIIIKNLLNIPIWVINAIINFPLFVLSFRILERRSFIKTLFATIMLTLFLGLLPTLDILTGDRLVDIIVGSVLMGGGLGLIFLTYASSGGTDLLATLINKRISYISIPKLLAIIDGIIVIIGGSIFGLTRGIYSVLAIYLITKISDFILEGPNRAKLIYVISADSEPISEYIMSQLGRGVTLIKAEGAYTNKMLNIVMCVVSDREMVKIKKKVYEIDDRSMCFVWDIREAFGEGFTKIRG